MSHKVRDTVCRYGRDQAVSHEDPSHEHARAYAGHKGQDQDARAGVLKIQRGQVRGGEHEGGQQVAEPQGWPETRDSP